MKKVMMSIVAIALAAGAQAQFYIKGGIGIAMPAASTIVARKTTATEQEIIKGSFGKGIAPVVGVGYMFSKHVGAEVGVSYLMGGKYESSSESQGTTTTTDLKATALNILPAIVVKSGDQDSKVRVFSRAGLMITPGAKFVSESKIVSGPNTTKATIEYKSNLALGYTGALGLSYNINKMLGLWIEAVGNSTSSWLKSGEVTEATFNGVDNLSSYTGAAKSWNYEDKVSNTSNDRPAYSEPMSSIGINVGVTVSLNSK